MLALHKLLGIVLTALYLGKVKCQRDFKQEIIFDITSVVDENYEVCQDGGNFLSQISKNSTIFISTDEPLNLWINNKLPKLATLMDGHGLSELIVAFEFEYGFSDIHDFTGGIPEEARSLLESPLTKLKGVVISTTGKDCVGNLQGKTLSSNQTLGSALKEYFLENFPTSSVTIMFGYIPSNIECEDIVEQAASADGVILTFEFDTSLYGNFVNSYSLFKSHLQAIVFKNEAFLEKNEIKPEVIVRLKITPRTNTWEVIEQEKALIGFFTRWRSETGNEIILPVSNSTYFTGTKNNMEKITWVIPSYWRIAGDCTTDRMSAIKEISTVFSTVFVDSANWECLDATLSQNVDDPLFKFSTGNSYLESGEVKIYIEVDMNSQHLAEADSKPTSAWFLNNYLNPPRPLPGLKIEGLLFPQKIRTSTGSEDCSESYYNDILKNYSDNVPIGIFYPGTDINNYFSSGPNPENFIAKMCSAMKAFGTFIVLEYVVDLNTLEYENSPHNFFLEEVLRRLNILLKLRTEILKEPKLQEISVYLLVSPVLTPQIQSDFGRGIYCGKDLKIFDSFVEAVVNWGKFASFPIIIKQVTNHKFLDNIKPYWLRPLSPFVEGDWTTGRFYSVQNLEILERSKGESCIEWTESVDENGISFDNGYIGVTVDLRGVNSSENEGQLMLRFAAHKFKNLEVIVDDSENGEILKLEELSTINSLVVDLRLQNDPDITIISQFENFQNVVEKVPNGNMNFTGVHISGWEGFRLENEFNESIQSFKEFAQSHQFKVGLTIENCGDEVTRLVSEKETYLDQVSYIVCNMDRIEATNEDKLKMTELFDRQLLTVKILRRRLPSLNVFFRLNLFLEEMDLGKIGSEAYLKFVNDVTIFAKVYHVNYYLAAFGNPSENEVGWWKVPEDKSNILECVEREAEYLKKETWKPKQLEEEVPEEGSLEGGSGSTSSIIIYTGIALLLVGIICAAVFFGMKYRKRTRFLSELEVQQFYNGDLELTYILSLAVATYKARRFLRTFEIPKTAFNLVDTNIIGGGQFTTYYKENIRCRPVAVKVVNSTCGKDLFLGVLSEVKMLCFVGRHENVVEFVGAYTQEIQRGTLFVAMEFCEMGPLLGYLKKEGEKKDEHVDIQELIGFATEIATGMDYIGMQDILHGSLSSRNVLLTKNKICKIGNFGLSSKFGENLELVKDQWRWMAYESLTQKEFTTMSDVWSFGVTLWEIFTLGEVPFSRFNWNAEFEENVKEGLRLGTPPHSTKTIFEIMQTCWKIEPALRPKFEDLRISFGNMRCSEELLF